MGKILDNEFRKDLYKSLMEAGYDKSEAQKIVGVKYFEQLKADLCSGLNSALEEIASNNFDSVLGRLDGFAASLSELNKLKDVVSGK